MPAGPVFRSRKLGFSTYGLFILFGIVFKFLIFLWNRFFDIFILSWVIHIFLFQDDISPYRFGRVDLTGGRAGLPKIFFYWKIYLLVFFMCVWRLFIFLNKIINFEKFRLTDLESLFARPSCRVGEGVYCLSTCHIRVTPLPVDRESHLGAWRCRAEISAT